MIFNDYRLNRTSLSPNLLNLIFVTCIEFPNIKMPFTVTLKDIDVSR